MPQTETNGKCDPTTRDMKLGMGNTSLIDAAVQGNLAEVNRILDEYPEYKRYIDLADTQTEDGYQNTALILAVFGGHTEMAIRLIDCGADVSLANNRGVTPLHYACLLRDHVLIEKLLSKEARWDAQNKDGVTPLDFYLYDWTGFSGERVAIRELDLMYEHRPEASGFLHDRPSINDELLRKTDLNTHQKVIPDLIKTVIPQLVKDSSPVYISNKKAKFKTSIFAYAFKNHEAFMHQFTEIKGDDTLKNSKMRDITEQILVAKYGQPRSYIIKASTLDESESVKRSPFAGIGMMVLGGFIAAIGVAAVALAFTVLSAATLGIAGLAIAAVGAGLALSGVGIFATGAIKSSEESSKDSKELSVQRLQRTVNRL